MPGNSDKKKVMALMFAVIGIVLLIVSLMLPWWGVHTKVEDTSEYGYSYESGGGVSIASGFGYSGGGTSMYSGDFSTPLIFGVTTMFMILALLFASLMTVYIIISLFGKNIKPKLPTILGILAIIFCILAPTIFMIALPGAMQADAKKRAEDNGGEYVEPDHDDPTKSFFGEYKDDSDEEIEKMNWGGDIGWILSLIAFTMLLISVVFVIPKKSTFPPQQQIPQQGYVPKQQSQVQAQQMQPLTQDQYYQDPPPQRYDQAPPPPPQNSPYEYPPPPQEQYPREY